MSMAISWQDKFGSVRRAIISVHGGFDIRTADEVWQACHDEHHPCQIYILDLADIEHIHANALDWLHNFIHWARQAGRSVRILNASGPITDRLAQAGISGEGTAQEQPRSYTSTYPEAAAA